MMLFIKKITGSLHDYLLWILVVETGIDKFNGDYAFTHTSDFHVHGPDEIFPVAFFFISMNVL